MAPFYVCIEGIIGAGKTSLLNELSKPPSFGDDHYAEFVLEPVNKYCSININGNFYNPLKEMYLSPHKNVPLVQDYILDWAAVYYGCRPVRRDCTIWCSERSIFSSQVFTEAYYEIGVLTEFSRDYLLQKNRDVSTCLPKPDLIVFLNIDVDEALKRVQNRSRAGENMLSAHFQQVLLEKYKMYLDSHSKIPILWFDVQKFEGGVSDLASEVKSKILEKYAEARAAFRSENLSQEEDIK